MGKILIHEFDPVIYPLKLWVIKNPTDNIIGETFEEFDGTKINYTPSKTSAASTYNKVICNKETQKYGVLVLIKSKTTINYIAHEATHVARIFWDWLDEEATGREADAYLVGWIAKCIDEVKRFKG